MITQTAQRLAELVDPTPISTLRLLDIAAGPGLNGIAFARRNPLAKIFAVDWPQVLDVAAGDVAHQARFAHSELQELSLGGHGIIISHQVQD